MAQMDFVNDARRAVVAMLGAFNAFEQGQVLAKERFGKCARRTA